MPKLLTLRGDRRDHPPFGIEGGGMGASSAHLLASATKIDALARAAARGACIAVAVDRLDLVEAYAEAASRHGTGFDVFVDLDTGLKRSGVANGREAVALARAVAEHPSLRYVCVKARAATIKQLVCGFTRPIVSTPTSSASPSADTYDE